MATFDQEKTRLKKALTDTIRILSVETANYFREQMQKEVDINGTPYTPRKYETSRQKGKRILQDRDNLKASIQPKSLNMPKLSYVVGTSEAVDAYAEIHNEGGEIEVTQKMKGFFWSQYYEAIGGKRKLEEDEEISEDAKFWRGMAYKKVGDKIVIPKREYLGDSQKVREFINKRAKEVFKKQFDK